MEKDSETLFLLQSQIVAMTEELQQLKRSLKKESPLYIQRILVKSNGKFVALATSEIDWIEAWGDYVRIHCRGKNFIVRQKISDLEANLDKQCFLRISRSAIVRADKIRELEPLHHGDYLVLLEGGTQLNASRNYREGISALFSNSF